MNRLSDRSGQPSWHAEDTSDKPDPALLKTAPRVPGLLREIVDEHGQGQLSRRSALSSPAQMRVAGILEAFSAKATFRREASESLRQK